MANRKILPFAPGWHTGARSTLGCTWMPDPHPHAAGDRHNYGAEDALVRPQQAGRSWIGSVREVGETLTAVVMVARFFIFIAGILVQHGLRSLWRGAVRRDTRGLRYRPECGGAAAIRVDVPSRDHAGLKG